MIQGVQVKTLKVIADERGWLMEMLRKDDDLFAGFGQVYMTAGYPGVVKGWHYHKKQIDNFACIKSMMKVVLYDPREDSATLARSTSSASESETNSWCRSPRWCPMASRAASPPCSSTP